MTGMNQDLPPELGEKLAGAARRAARVAALQTVFGMLFAAGAVVLAFLVLERLWAFPRFLRATALLLAVAGMLGFLLDWLVCRWRDCRRPFAVIRRIERHYPALGDSLRGVIELAGDESARSGISESLRQAAMRQVEQHCRPLDFGAAISTSRLRTHGRWVAVLAVLLVACAWFEPALLRSSLHRLVRPWAAVPRYTFVRLNPLPAIVQVARGEEFAVAVGVAADSRWTPGRLHFRLGRGARNVRPLEGGGATLGMPGITEPVSLRLRLGDAAATVRFEPVARPVLLELVGEVVLPAYLARGTETVEFTRRPAHVTEGSRLSLRGTALNPLASAWLEDGKARRDLAVEGREFVSPERPVEELREVALHWRDSNGLGPAEPWRLELEVVPDAAPSVQFETVSRVVAILEEEVLDLAIRARDDFGVRAVEVAWEAVPMERPESPPAAVGRRAVGVGGPGQPDWSGDFAFSPRRLGLAAGSRVTVRALANDYKPGRSFSESQPLVVFVLTPSDHARLVENQLAALRNRMEEMALREAQLLADNEELAGLDEATLARSETQSEVERQAERERRSVEDWQALAEEGARLLAEATRNEAFPVETLAEWTEIMAAVHDVAADFLPEAAGALAEAGQSPEGRREALERAVAAQRQALEALKQSVETLGDSLDLFAVLNLAARLRALAERENRLGEGIQALFPQTIGLAVENLPPELAERVGELASRQKDIENLVFGIRFESQRFWENTGIEKYERVVAAMAAAKLEEDMPLARESLAGNRLAQAVGEVRRWARHLEEWATLLDEKRDGEGGGGGQGGGEMSEEAAEFMLALLRAIQEQDRLRRDAAGLEAEKEHIADYAPQAERLAASETELAESVVELAERLRPSQVRNDIEDAAGLMERVAAMLAEPRTDREVRADMGSAIELLLQVFESNCQGGECQASAMLAMMARSLGLSMSLGSGAAPGGSPGRQGFEGAGGTGVGGTGSGTSAERSGYGAIEATPAEFPVEYREQLERFFRRVEAE